MGTGVSGRPWASGAAREAKTTLRDLLRRSDGPVIVCRLIRAASRTSRAARCADPRGAGPRSDHPETLTGSGDPQQATSTGQHPAHGAQAARRPGPLDRAERPGSRLVACYVGLPLDPLHLEE